jgi:hypothetical protein
VLTGCFAESNALCIVMSLLPQTSDHVVRDEVSFPDLCAAVERRIQACDKPITMTTVPTSDGLGGQIIRFRSLDDGITMAVAIFFQACDGHCSLPRHLPYSVCYRGLPSNPILLCNPWSRDSGCCHAACPSPSSLGAGSVEDGAILRQDARLLG